MNVTSSPITYDDFAKVDLRVGRVLEVQPFPKARNPSWKVRVDLGEFGEKWSSAQITNYAAEQLVGSLVVCVCNFSPRNIAGFMSEVLILGAPNADGKVILLSPRKDDTGRDIVAPGAKVY
ncbi:tRNA-binding protein [Afipia massiliensis]|uniref:tRNA-binding protein n=1 Tax=Afipia massiliensis TaxID=211460 RepID=A0A4U6BT47_9BRAD|nr:tRNA-binding protein [Afipia massiliensis]TKT71964.1 tRNA-binding protein [Afipia massiliensis]